MTMTTRVLPADVFDALEFSALAFGGIGANQCFENNCANGVPVCIYGHTAAVTDNRQGGEPFQALERARIDSWDNDTAVRRVNERRGKRRCARITFRQWCAELDVVRGA